MQTPTGLVDVCHEAEGVINEMNTYAVVKLVDDSPAVLFSGFTTTRPTLTVGNRKEPTLD